MSNGLRRGKFLKRAGLVILVGACAMLLSASQASAVLVDHFTDGVFDIGIGKSHGASTADVTSLNGGTMIGGYRFTTLHYDSGDLINYSEEARVTTTSHGLIWEEGDSIKGKLTILYNANGAGLGGVDVTNSGASSQWLFAVVQGGGDGTRFDVTITVVDSSNATESFTAAFTGFGTFALPFSTGSGSADLTQVKSIQYMFDSAQGGQIISGVPSGGGDYTFDLLGTGTIPEPLTMLGMFLGLGSVGAYIRKRRMA